MNVEAINLPVPVRHRRRFWRHFAEMVVVMLLSMAILGAAVSAAFALAGHANLLHFAALRGLLMTAYMVIGMALWMRHRRHGWARITEMSAAMVAPYVVLVGPFLGGVIGKGAFLAAMHVLMLPSMYVAMVLRRDEYERDHRDHGHEHDQGHEEEGHGNDERSGRRVPVTSQDRGDGCLEGPEDPRIELRVPAAP
jgi:flagellar biosynthetic protein FliP